MVDVLAEAAQALDAQEPARPEAQLLRIHVEGVLGRTQVGRDVVPPAAGHTLERLQQVNVQHHAVLPECVPQPSPAAGQTGAGPDVASPGGGDVDGLRARGARHAQQDQSKDGRPDAGGAIHADVQMPVVFLMTHMVLLVTCC